jgi:hypothetical protein
MKKITVLLLGIMLAIVSYAQSNISQNREVYAFVMVIKSTDKTTAKIDFGDGSPLMAFADEKGKKRKFETTFEPINLLIKNGWEIEKFSSLFSNINLITHWVMKKKVNEESEVKECMILIED